MTTRKYKRGRAIRSLAALSREFVACNYIFHNHKPLHRAWWGSWPMQLASREIRAGRLFYARKIVKESAP